MVRAAATFVMIMAAAAITTVHIPVNRITTFAQTSWLQHSIEGYVASAHACCV